MEKQKTYQTINILILALLIIYFLRRNEIFLYLAIILSLNNLIYFQLNELITKAWLKFAEKFGAINSKIILTIIFYALVVPMGYLYRIFNSRKIMYIRKDIQNTYFVDVKESYTKTYFLKQW